MNIIALLISILLPTLSRARAAAQSVQCLTNLRSFSLAQVNYQSEWRGWSIPGIFGAKTEFWPAPNDTLDKRGSWFDNDTFRKSISVAQWVGGNGTAGRLPIGLTCPLAYQARTSQTNDKGTSLGYSYGYNIRHLNYNNSKLIWTIPTANTWNANTVYAGVKLSSIQRASEKIMFADAMTAFIQPQNSDNYFKFAGFDDYRDPLGDEDTAAYVAYRHGKNHTRINASFWDGHAESLHRSEVVAVKDATLALPARRLAPNWTLVWNKRWDLGAR